MSNLKAYKYRLYPNKKQAEKLQWTVDRARELYNAAIQERRDAYEIRVKRHPNYHDEATRKHLTQAHALTYNQQATQLPESVLSSDQRGENTGLPEISRLWAL